jgi:hypothetical protein
VLPDEYGAGHWNEQTELHRHYLDYDINAKYEHEEDLPLHWELLDESMGPDVDADVNPHYALGCLAAAFIGLGGVFALAGSLAPESPVGPRELPFNSLAAEYGHERLIVKKSIEGL